MLIQSSLRPGEHRLQVRGALIALPLWSALLLAPGSGRSATVTVAGIAFDTANATSTASIVSGGYATPHGIALHSGTSPSWTIADSLGTRFLVPTFQSNYSPDTANTGLAGSAITLGQDANFPQTSSNPRDIIQLGWGAGRGLGNLSGNDLAIFEAATSEALGVRLYVNGASTWTDWHYTPYERVYDTPNDATATQIDFADFGVGASAVVTAIEITNLLISDRVATLIDGTPDLGLGRIDFSGSSGYQPGRYSTSQGAWVPFEANKFDPDIQYVVGLHDLTTGSFGSIAAASFSLPLSPLFAPATQVEVPVPTTLALMLALLGWPWWRPRTPRREFPM